MALMTHSEKATALVSSFEGFSAVAYLDGNSIPTIGYGHTADVKMGDVCTKTQALVWLDEDLKIADDAIARLVTVPLTQNEWDALTSLVYNIGQGNFAKSTVHLRINHGDTNGACQAIGMWNKVAGQVSAGLVRRRAAEMAMFRGEA